jgi:hypothetical protein
MVTEGAAGASTVWADLHNIEHQPRNSKGGKGKKELLYLLTGADSSLTKSSSSL